MRKQKWKAGNMIYPLPAVMVSCGDETAPNIITIAWTGTICTNPAMTYISVRKTRHSYDLIKNTGYFVINLTTRNLVKATDYCGVRSGKDVNKFEEMHLTAMYDEETGCPMIGESPVSVVCEVTEIKELGSHDMFLAKVLNVYVDEDYLDEKGKFHLNKTDLIAYSHGEYFTLGDKLGTFGYSVMKKNTQKRKTEDQQVVKEKTVTKKKKTLNKTKSKKKTVKKR
ncbi:MAG: flavin reductase family protein [Cellulosilyticaceae bacterium]